MTLLLSYSLGGLVYVSFCAISSILLSSGLAGTMAGWLSKLEAEIISSSLFLEETFLSPVIKNITSVNKESIIVVPKIIVILLHVKSFPPLILV